MRDTYFKLFERINHMHGDRADLRDNAASVRHEIKQAHFSDREQIAKMVLQDVLNKRDHSKDHRKYINFLALNLMSFMRRKDEKSSVAFFSEAMERVLIVSPQGQRHNTHLFMSMLFAPVGIVIGAEDKKRRHYVGKIKESFKWSFFTNGSKRELVRLWENVLENPYFANIIHPRKKRFMYLMNKMQSEGDSGVSAVVSAFSTLSGHKSKKRHISLPSIYDLKL